MSALEMSRLQFAVVTIYHYLFVPLSISLAALTAGLHTAWWRTRDERWWRLTLVVGKLLMATFAVGVVTGLVQEFQFGMSWSAFARFYGDVFGPTLAIEGMLAFFLEATFLGLWWFGRGRLGPRLHLATIWVVAVGTLISAYVILAANAFMQSPVGYTLDPVTHRAVLGSFSELLTNPVVLAAAPHTIAGAFASGGALVLAIGAWRAWGHGAERSWTEEGGHAAERSWTSGEGGRRTEGADRGVWRSLARVGAWTTLLAGVASALTGDALSRVMTTVQPMKMAAAEALYTTQAGAPYSLFAIGSPGSHEPAFSLDVPWLLSVLATGDPTATVRGIDDLQAQYAAQFGPGNYTPWIPVAYWSFRAMIGLGVLATALAAWVLWRTRRGRDLTATATATAPGWAGLADRALLRTLWLLPLLPTAAATFGWIFTETARQPWLVFGLFRTADGVSPTLTAGELALSLAGFALVYGALALVWVRLVLHIARHDLPAAASVEAAAAPEPVPSY